MKELISYCGLSCDSCPIFLAGREDDNAKKDKIIFEIIDSCKTYYGIEYKYEDINDCDGCKSTGGKIFISCKDCKIRDCAINKEIDSCAYCNDYACEKLDKIFKSEPAAKDRLDKIRSGN